MWRVLTRVAAQEALLVPLLQIAVLAVAGSDISVGPMGVGPGDAASVVAIAERAVPGLLGPFLQHDAVVAARTH